MIEADLVVRRGRARFGERVEDTSVRSRPTLETSIVLEVHDVAEHRLGTLNQLTQRRHVSHRTRTLTCSSFQRRIVNGRTRRGAPEARERPAARPLRRVALAQTSVALLPRV